MIPAIEERTMKPGKSSFLFAAALVVASLPLRAGAGQAAQDRLTVTQDESSMERVIQSYLIARHKLIVSEKAGNADDLYLELPFKEDPVPAFRMMIDTLKTNHDSASNKTIERAVVLTVFSNIKVPQDRRVAVLNILNDFNADNIFSGFYIASDGEIVCCWAVNVMAEGMPTEYVYDAVHRVVVNWRGLYPATAMALK
jgi:hypothetical protein